MTSQRSTPNNWFLTHCPRPKNQPIFLDIVGLDFTEKTLDSLQYLGDRPTSDLIKLARALHSLLYKNVDNKYAGYIVLDLASRLPSPDNPDTVPLFSDLKGAVKFPNYQLDKIIDPSVQDTLVSVDRTTVSFMSLVRDKNPSSSEKKDETDQEKKKDKEPTNNDSAVGGEYERSAIFCAAFLLRALVKSSDSVVNAWSSLADRYQSFYQAEFHPTFAKVPTEEKVESLKKKLTASPLISVSWIKLFARLETSLNQRSTSFRMLRYLCFLPLSWAGMHAFKLFANYVTQLRADGYWLLGQLMLPQHWPGIKTIHSIMTTQLPQEGVSERKVPFYKYARLLDSAFYADLQTSNCLSLTYTLAKLTSLECQMAPNADPMKIKLLENITSDTKEFLDRLASKIVLLRPTSQIEMYSEAGKMALEDQGTEIEPPQGTSQGVSFVKMVQSRKGTK